MKIPKQEINRLLASVALGIRQSLDLEEILHKSVAEVRDFLECDRVIIYRFYPDWSGAVIVESVAQSQWSILGSRIKDPCFENTWVEYYQQGNVTARTDINQITIDPCYQELLQNFNVTANLVVPIIQTTSNQTIQLWGLLIAHQCQHSREWQEVEIEFLKQLTTQIGIAIAQAELLALTKYELRQRQLAQQKVQQARHFLQTTIDHLPVAVFVKDASQSNFGKFLLWNKASERMFGLRAEQALGKTVYDYFCFSEANLLNQQDQQAFETRTVIEIPEQIITIGTLGKKILRTTKVPIFDDLGQPEYLLCIAEDITRRHQAEVQLQQKSEELAAFSSNLKQLHRLNTTNYATFDQLFHDYVQTGCRIFGCSTGIVSHIEGDIYTIYAVTSDLTSLSPNQQFELGNTYCAEVVKQKKTIAYHCVGTIEELRSHPVYQNFKLETYIGTPIFVEQAIYGTLNFSSTKIRNLPFTSHEREIIEMMAQSIGKFINAHQIELQRQQAVVELQQAKQELEDRVKQRTEELSQTNQRLQQELYQRQQAQVALEESEARFRSMVNSFPMLVWVSGSDSHSTFFNQAWLEFTGRTMAEELAHGWSEGVHPDDQSQYFNTYQTAFNNRQPFQLEYRLKRADGEYRWMLDYGAPRFRPDGSFAGFIGSCLDISDRKQIEATLQESEKRWRTLLENVRLLVIGMDLQGRLDYANPFFLELMGYTVTEAIGKHFIDLVHPQNRQEAVKIFQSIIQPNSPYYYHHQKILLTKSGEEKRISWNSTQMCDLQGKPIGMMCIGEDITARHAMERMKDEFISVVSHELRTPLTSIHGALGLLVSGIVQPQSEQGQRIIKIAAESTESLVRLVNDILELERLESGKIDLIKKIVQVQEIMLKAIELVQLIANRAGIILEVTNQNLEFYGDCDRIVQVLTNLLTNAIKFSERGSRVWLDVVQQSDQILFVVQDQGRGIPSDKLETIFERFHQVDASDSRRKGGTGLGLAICRNIVEQHGGKIWAESIYGKGSNFFFTIPLVKADEINN
ncbi:multi-sensor signal transduction histidine kinase [Stanieria cyanosphaera PCC 7437]|uniref:histidine kinase n=1 Tax=Stanieria cyanosphaera (strain ATCC 29371 / PCC 7437) TaxID=111780 RepID=K9XQF4_STAC7|nr:PAS domain S-box protein [Stanieria cyanosphaera]AFZ34850.1 multi-sensor signal transduction histidine kinase [Stanieria cyanosphaera PCC 7437]